MDNPHVSARDSLEKKLERMEPVGEKGRRVCVTGAGGYIASWLVKLLLSNGYKVHGTVRNSDALLLVYQKQEASGRYICAPHTCSLKELSELLKRVSPKYDCLSKINEAGVVTRLSSEKLKALGWNCRALESSVIDSIEYYQKVGLLEDKGFGLEFPPLYNM